MAFIPQSGVIIPGNPAPPLLARNLEFGIKRDWFKGRWNTTLSVYQIWRNNILGADVKNSTGTVKYSLPIGQTITKGIEFDLRGALVSSLNLIFNYALTDSRVSKSDGIAKKGYLMTGFAKHISNGWLSYQFPATVLKGLGFSLGYQYQKGRTGSNFYGLVADKPTEFLPDYFSLDGALSWSNNKTSIQINLNNLLNNYNITTAYIRTNFNSWQTEPPRNIRLGITYKL